MQETAAHRPWPPALVTGARLVSFAVVCGLLYWGQFVLIPLALAALVTFLLSPLVTRLHRLGLPRVAAVMIVVSCTTGAVAGVGSVVVGELTEFAEELPAYRQNIRAKIADLREMTRGGTLERVQATIEDIGADIERDAAAEAAADGRDPGGEDAEAEPVQVEIAERRPFSDVEMLGPLLEAAATAGLVLLLSVFMLIKREDLRNRLVSLAGQASLAVTTRAFAEAGQRISRYLLMQFIINASMGLAVWLGLFLIGVPHSALWGLSAAVLRYVPYVGPWVAALLPITVSLVTSPGWTEVALVIGFFVTLELLSNNVMEPWLYGQSVGLSAIAVIVSVIFWTWLWGPVGLVLATPITACLVVLGRHIPGLSALDRLLGEGPALEPHVALYQRLLARDEDEAEYILARHLRNHDLAETCDDVLVGSLLILERDLAGRRISAEDGAFVASALREMVDGLEVPAAAKGVEDAHEDDYVLLLGFPPRDELDEIALATLQALLRPERVRLEILSPDRLVGERIAEVEERAPAAVCIVSLPPGDLTPTRHVCRRLRARLPALKVLVARVGAPDAPERSRQLLRSAGAQHVAGSLQELRDALLSVARDAKPSASVAEGASAADPDPAPDPAGSACEARASAASV